MKRMLIIFTTMIGLFLLNGCSNGDNYYEGFDEDRVTTLFLVDENGFTYGGIPYKCDSMREWSTTRNNGEFTFVQPDTCKFDFNGLAGLYGDNLDDIIRIVDYTNDGKGGIPYECSSFGVSLSYSDGSFDYDENDVCVFRL